MGRAATEGRKPACFSRAELLSRGALGVAGLYGLGMVGPYTRRALAAFGEDEVEVLNFALKFEHLEVALFEEGMRRLKPTGKLRRLLEDLATDERRHVQTLTAKIEEAGGKPVAEGNHAFAYPNVYEFLRLAREIEDNVVAAYNGALPVIRSEELVALLGSIVQVEGRHAAAVSMQRLEEPAPEAFDLARNEFEGLSSVERFTGPGIF